jgi:hypothetical protein
MIGAGLQTAGTTYAGWGDFDPVAPAPTIVAGARFIGNDRDYMIDPATGAFAKMRSVKQRVMLAISTQLNSSCLQDFGIIDGTKIGSGFVAAMQNSIRVALKTMVDAEEIRIDEIKVEQVTSNRVLRTVYYTELQTNHVDSAMVG